MDYYKIGQRIRKFRKAQGLSQDELAEKVNISVTHMSHIETGNTKLSLPVLVELANVLDVQTDDLLNDREIVGRSKAQSELSLLLDKCNNEQLCMITDVVKSLLDAVNKYFT